MSFIADESKAYTLLDEQRDNDWIKSLNDENSNVQVDEEGREAALTDIAEKEIDDEGIEQIVKEYSSLEDPKDKRDHSNEDTDNQIDDSLRNRANAADENKERENSFTDIAEKEIDDAESIKQVVKEYYVEGPAGDKRDHNDDDNNADNQNDESLTGGNDKEREAEALEKVVSAHQVSDVKERDQNDDEEDEEEEEDEREEVQQEQETSLEMMFSKSIKVGKVKLKRDAATVNNVALYGGEQLNTIVKFTNPELLKRIHLAAEVLTAGF